MASGEPKRLSSLDQFRGYAVAGMIVVNFLGGYACTPRVLRHTNDYCSYADTIMPNFLFAVGFAIALVWNRAPINDPDGQRRIQFKLMRRSLALMFVALLLYFPWDKLSAPSKLQDNLQADLLSKLLEPGFWFTVWKREWFQTLTHIAWTTLWLIPILPWSWKWRWCWLIGGVVLHVGLSEWFYFHWVHADPSAIDGGPLGFLTWAIPAGLGLYAGDRWNRTSPRLWMVLALILMVSGYLLSCGTRAYDRPQNEGGDRTKLAASPVMGVIAIGSRTEGGRWAEPPFVPPPDWHARAWNYWMMSQKGGTASYLIFSAGFSLGLFLLFDSLVKRFGVEVGLFRSLGRNAIVCYALHGFLIDMIG